MTWWGQSSTLRSCWEEPERRSGFNLCLQIWQTFSSLSDDNMYTLCWIDGFVVSTVVASEPVQYLCLVLVVLQVWRCTPGETHGDDFLRRCWTRILEDLSTAECGWSNPSADWAAPWTLGLRQTGGQWQDRWGQVRTHYYKWSDLFIM